MGRADPGPKASVAPDAPGDYLVWLAQSILQFNGIDEFGQLSGREG
jgi:hypothetical protein